MMSRKHTITLLLLFALLLLLAGAGVILWYPAGSPPVTEDETLAEVGGIRITLHDFVLNYEFGLPLLKRGATPADRRRSYLNAMINEMLLASEGYRLGYDQHPRVIDNDREIATESLIEALLDEEVVKKTTVTDEEIRAAIIQSTVRVKVRFWGEATERGAKAVRSSMAAKGFAPVLDSLFRARTDVALQPSDFETEYMNALEIEPAVLQAIQHLEAGEVSQPVPVRDAYYVFQLMDIRRLGMMEHDVAARNATTEKILLNRKYDEGIAAFVAPMMRARNIVTRGGAFWKLADAVAEWIASKDHQRTSLRDAVLSAPADNHRYRELRAIRNQPMVTYTGGTWTVEEFLGFFKPSIRDLNPSAMEPLRRTLNQQVGWAVRNQLLAAEARRRSMEELPSVRRERRMWMNKSVYEEVRHKYVGHFRLEQHSAETLKRILHRKADSLRAITRVVVNNAILDTLTIPEAEHSGQMGMQLFKVGSRRPAVPMTDGVWGRP